MYKTIIAIIISGAALAACTDETPTTEGQAAENRTSTAEYSEMHAGLGRYKALAETSFVYDYPTPEATRTLDE